MQPWLRPRKERGKTGEYEMVVGRTKTGVGQQSPCHRQFALGDQRHSFTVGISAHYGAESYDSEEELRLAQEEWEESLEQLQQLVSIVLLPFLGKWLGRRWSHWAYARYLKVGLGKSFFFGERTYAS
ncbi:hypothetical protein ABKN59_000861 [Abortiporus biennis]